MSLLLRLIDAISRFFFGLAMLTGLLMMLHVTADVIARTVFNMPLTGTGEISAGYYMIVMAFLPLACVTLNDQHLSADLFTARLSPRVAGALQLVIDLVSAGYAYLLMTHTVTSALRRTRSGEVWEVAGGYLPIWPIRWVIPVAMGAMLAVLVLRVLQRLLGRPVARLEEA